MPTLILVDIQNDFLPGGSLAVPGGDQIIPLTNKLMKYADQVVATLDWHPPGHRSFASQHPGRRPGEIIDLDGLEQMLWPDHCVQWTGGAALGRGLTSRPIQRLFTKGEDPAVDSYSGFWDNGRRKHTALQGWLETQKTRQLWVCGLALDYCVKATALDAQAAGFQTTVVLDATRAVNPDPSEVHRVVTELQGAGVHMVHSMELWA